VPFDSCASHGVTISGILSAWDPARGLMMRLIKKNDEQRILLRRPLLILGSHLKSL
jgi:hypothetical protein